MQFSAGHAVNSSTGRLYIAVDDLTRWTRQLEQLRGPSPGLDELRRLIETWRSQVS